MLGRKTVRKGAVMGLSVLTGACSYLPSIGPDYEEPKMELPATFASVSAPTASESTPLPPVDEALKGWWTKFKEPTLEQLVTKAVEQNHDVRIAADRLLQARAIASQTASEFYPQIDASGSYTKLRISRAVGAFGLGGGNGGNDGGGNGGGGIGNDPATPVFIANVRDLYNVGLNASWQLDVLGGTRRAYEAAGADVAAQEELFNGVLLTLLSDVARNYISLRSLQKRVAIAHHNIRIQEESLSLVEARFSAGISSELDVAQARAQLESTRSQLPLLEQSLRATAFRLSVLLGQPPETEMNTLLSSGPSSPDDSILNGLPELTNVGVPSDLLRRRPDIRSSERSLAAATARVGEAIAEFFPSFDITATFGGQSTDSRGVWKDRGRYWSFVPGVRLPIFQGGRILAGVRANRAQAHEALMQYERTVLTALEETENAFTALQKQRERKEALKRAYAATQRALALSRQLYEQGLVDFLRVIEAERSAYAAEDQLVQSEEQLALNTVQIFTALGGGW